jgi:hypothetical protein
LAEIRDYPKLEGQVAILYLLGTKWLGYTSLFVASYDSQGYGGGIRPRLHKGFAVSGKFLSF